MPAVSISERRSEPDAPERPPDTVRVWIDGYLPPREASFEPVLGRFGFTLKIPFGWSFVADEASGVVLRNVFGDSVDAVAAYMRAARGKPGWRFLP